jgi:transcriptional regulator with XRE-family HTH domain
MLKEIIKNKGVKQKWLAQQIGVSEVTISNWVKGIHEPNDEHLTKMADILNIELSILKNEIK